MLIKAPYIVTLDGPVLKNHALLAENGIIQAIAPQSKLNAEKCLELPGTILFPGLVNCHCHLELSKLPEPLLYPGTFAGWIEELTRLKLQMTPEKTISAIQFGIQKVIEGGTTTIADHVSVGTPLEPLLESALEGVAYVEVLGLERKRAEYFLEEAMGKRGTRDQRLETRDLKKCRIIPTPHSTYSLLPEIFVKLKGVPLSIHIAESAEEFLLFKENGGPLFDFLATKGKTPPTIGETPVAYLHRLNLLPKNGMAIHANYLEDEDVALLLDRQMSVVHCPGSHAYFEHDRFPLGMLQDAGINIALGTDSLASNNSLSMLEEMRRVLDNYVELSPEAALKMATLGGAKALGKEKEIGSLTVGKKANIIGVPLRYPKQSLYENILLSEKVVFGMIKGQVLPSQKGML